MSDPSKTMIRNIVACIPKNFLSQELWRIWDGIEQGSLPPLSNEEQALLSKSAHTDGAMAKAAALSGILRKRTTGLSPMESLDQIITDTSLSTEDMVAKEVAALVAARRQDLTTKNGQLDLMASICDICQRYGMAPESHLRKSGLLHLYKATQSPKANQQPHRSSPTKKQAKIHQEITYMPSMLVHCSLPAQNPDTPLWQREDGDWRLVISSGTVTDPETGMEVMAGIPYGKLPRLIMLEVSSQAVISGNRKIQFGETFAATLRQLGLSKSGGKTGSVMRLRDQMLRLFLSQIVYKRFQNLDGKTYRDDFKKVSIADSGSLFWHLENPEHAIGEDSHIVLSQPFFAEILKTGIPVEAGTVRSLLLGRKGSTLAFDLYCLLTNRVSHGGNRTITIPYPDLMKQLGVIGYAGHQGCINFKYKLTQGLTRIFDHWPEAKHCVSPGVHGLAIDLATAKPHIVSRPKTSRVIEMPPAQAEHSEDKNPAPDLPARRSLT